MLQLELYVANIAEAEKLFTSVFGLQVIKETPGYRHLRHETNYDIMLFNPSESPESEGHWPVPQNGNGGQGIEIVIVVTEIAAKLQAARKLGYECSELSHTPWNSVEFTFRLREGYLLRIKEPKPA